jgi:hypothetical protein
LSYQIFPDDPHFLFQHFIKERIFSSNPKPRETMKNQPLAASRQPL